MALNPSAGWQYYRKLNISNSGADYQIKLTLYKDDNTRDNPSNYEIDLDNRCSNFPNDIRFGTTSNPSTATQLAQWIEEETSTYIVIWVKLPNPSQNYIYLFVGNSSASEYSSGDDVFEFFDDFDGSTLDSNKWSVDSGIVYSIGNSKLTVTGDTNNHWNTPAGFKVQNFSLPSNSYYIKAKSIDWSGSSNNQITRWGILLSNSSASNWYQPICNLFQDAWSGYTGEKFLNIDSNSYHSGYNSLSLTGSTTLEIKKDENNVVSCFWGGSNPLGSYTSTSTIEDIYLFVNKYVNNPYYDSTSIEYFFIAKYLSTEPSFSSYDSWSSTEPEFAGGTGTLSDPYQISNWYHLNNVRNYSEKYFKLIADLDSNSDHYDDYASQSANGGAGWNPIGTGSSPWKGVFDGNNHSIKDLYIHRALQGTGLFGNITTDTLRSVIKNLNLSNFNYSLYGNYTYKGGLVGNLQKGDIYNCSVSGEITDPNGLGIGGIAGYINNNSFISGCSANIYVSGGAFVGGLIGQTAVSDIRISSSTAFLRYEGDGVAIGGLVGYLSDGNIYKSYASSNIKTTNNEAGGIIGRVTLSNDKNIIHSYSKGSISGNSYVGGAIGRTYNTSTKVYISGCYTRANISGSNYVGGFIGSMPSGIIYNSYAANKIKCNGSNYGGFCGYKNLGYIYNSFWDTTISNVTTSNGGTGKQTSDMLKLSTYSSAGWDIEKRLGILNDGYPVLHWQVSDNSPSWYLPICEKDVYIQLYDGSIICCNASRWDTSDYTFVLETWLKKDDFDKLLSHIKPGAVGELYKILDRPIYYDKTWEGKNTLYFIPNEDSSSSVKYLRNPIRGYVRNITSSVLEGPSKYIQVKLECFISGTRL